MHFIFLTLGYHPDHTGGAARYVTEVAERLAAKGHHVEAIFPGAAGQPPYSGERAGVRLFRYVNPAGPFWRNWVRENRIADRRLRRDQGGFGGGGSSALLVLVHAYYGRALQNWKGRAVFVFTGPWAEEHRFARQTRLSVHGAGKALTRQPPRRPGWQGMLGRWIVAGMRRAERKALRRVDRILTLSRYYEVELPRWHGGGLAPVRIVGAGVNARRFAPAADREAARSGLGLGADQFLFLSVRRLDLRMGLLTLVDAFARVAGDFPQARLWLAGAGPQAGRLAARVTELGVGEQARLLGEVPERDLATLLGAADCMVMPSLDLEGFGLATVEALACGTPVLGSRAGATPELLGSLSEALLFEAGSVEALAGKLAEVLGDPRLLPERAACRVYAVERFSWDNVASAFEVVYAELYPDGGGG